MLPNKLNRCDECLLFFFCIAKKYCNVFSCMSLCAFLSQKKADQMRRVYTLKMKQKNLIS